MFKYDIIAVIVTWPFGDLTIIRTYCDVGWDFKGYSPDGVFVYFAKKYKTKEV